MQLIFLKASEIIIKILCRVPENTKYKSSLGLKFVNATQENPEKREKTTTKNLKNRRTTKKKKRNKLKYVKI